MNLEQLKQKATASELTLIEKVETLMLDQITVKLASTVLRFIESNPPPSERDLSLSRSAYQDWFKCLQEFLGKSL